MNLNVVADIEISLSRRSKPAANLARPDLPFGISVVMTTDLISG